MVEAFVERGYTVDVIESTNHAFVPKYQYDYFIDNAENMERLAPLLPAAKKIFHITNAEPRFQNKAGQQRADELFARRGIRLQPDRNIPETRGIEAADMATALGNAFTIDTYAYAQKPITRIPISTTHLFPFPDTKDFDSARKQFVWIGGAGPLHKGLDLVLEAFASMPDYTLVICGKLKPGDPFAQAFKKELYETANITVLGFIDHGSEQFKTLCEQSLGVISASCSEGGGGSLIIGMHAGLIPLANYESSVDMGPGGVLLPNSHVETIQRAVRELAALPRDTLRQKAHASWQQAREHHTRERFAKEYRVFLDSINA